jgi:hypothetical protein
MNVIDLSAGLGVKIAIRLVGSGATGKPCRGMAFKPYNYSGFEKLIQNLRN